MMPTRFPELLRALSEAGVDFVVVGGAAAVARGSVRLTQDLDVAYRRTPDNMRKLARALSTHRPYLRGAPAGLPFVLDESTLRAGLNFTLVTDLGWIDLLGEVTGGGGYDELVQHSSEMELFGSRCRVLGLDKLIEVKRAAGRPKDLEVIAELEAIREEMERGG